MSGVVKLAPTPGRLWLVARPRGETNLAAGQGRLWTFSPDSNRIEALQGTLAEDAVRDLAVRSDGVWVAVEGGVVVLDPQTFVFDAFSAAQGITTRQLAGFAAAGRRLCVIGEPGTLFELQANGRLWQRLDPPATSLNPREPVRWRTAAGSADWVLAVGERGTELALRPVTAPQWGYISEPALRLIPRPELPAWTAVAGDQSGGFWLGSEAGLHWLVAETGSWEHQVAPQRPGISGGWGRTFGPHWRPTAAARAQVIARQTTEIRQRMRDRARLARVARDLRTPLDPLTPTSRLAGGVRALAVDGQYLWVATSDPLAPERSRVLLLHQANRQWLGWFAVGRPVMTMAADAGYLYLGLDVTAGPPMSPLLRIGKAPFVTVPERLRFSTRVTAAEVGARLAALPVRERAVHAFFSGDARTVVSLLANAPEPDAESLFLLAFAHDPLGLDQPLRHEAYLDALHTGFPESPFALASAGVRPARQSPTPQEPGNDAPLVIDPPSPVGIPSAPLSETPAQILTRRDLNRDGKLNLIEFRLWRGPTAEVRPYDRNGDGQLDETELPDVK